MKTEPLTVTTENIDKVISGIKKALKSAGQLIPKYHMFYVYCGFHKYVHLFDGNSETENCRKYLSTTLKQITK